MKPYEIRFSKKAAKDIQRLKPNLRRKLKSILRKISLNPYSGKKLVGKLKGYYSIRLSLKDRGGL